MVLGFDKEEGIYFLYLKGDDYVYDNELKNKQIINYTKNIKLNTFFNENGADIKNIMKEIVLNNCNPIKKNKI